MESGVDDILSQVSALSSPVARPFRCATAVCHASIWSNRSVRVTTGLEASALGLGRKFLSRRLFSRAGAEAEAVRERCDAFSTSPLRPLLRLVCF